MYNCSSVRQSVGRCGDGCKVVELAAPVVENHVFEAMPRDGTVRQEPHDPHPCRSQPRSFSDQRPQFAERIDEVLKRSAGVCVQFSGGVPKRAPFANFSVSPFYCPSSCALATKKRIIHPLLSPCVHFASVYTRSAAYTPMLLNAIHSTALLLVTAAQAGI